VESNDATKLRGRALAARADGEEVTLEHRHRPVKDRGQQVFLRAEVAVERRLRDADAPGELVERRRSISALAKEIGGRGENPRPQHFVPRAGARKPRAHQPPP
jgi:hypothetical protein